MTEKKFKSIGSIDIFPDFPPLTDNGVLNEIKMPETVNSITMMKLPVAIPSIG